MLAVPVPPQHLGNTVCRCHSHAETVRRLGRCTFARVGLYGFMPSLYVYPQEFERCVAVLSRKLEEVAVRAGVPDSECTDLERILAVLPAIARARADILLGGIELQAGEQYPAMAFAARYVLKLAREVWDEAPPPPPAAEAPAEAVTAAD
jgi:hypothetical protein